MKPIKQYTIFAIILGKKKYLEEISIRPDNRILPISYTEVPQEAHTWNTEIEAEKAISKIQNVHDREFISEPVMISPAKIKKIKIDRDELLY
jgi:hypothetical protein